VDSRSLSDAQVKVSPSARVTPSGPDVPE